MRVTEASKGWWCTPNRGTETAKGSCSSLRQGSWLEGEGGEGLMAASRAQLPVLTCVLRFKMDWM